MSYITPSQLKTVVQKVKEGLDTKSNIEDLESGKVIPAMSDYADLADNLTPYSEESGVTQIMPFFLEGTGTGNGESIADVGSYLRLKEKRGNMVCVNQLFDSLPQTQTLNGITLTNNGDGSITLDGTSTGRCDFSNTNSVSFTAGRKYLFCKINNVRIHDDAWYVDSGSSNNYAISQATNSRTVGLTISVMDSGITFSNARFYPKMIDLSQWFGSTDNIPAYLLSHPEVFGRYYKGPLTYEPGRLEPAIGRYFESDGRNIWDEEWEVGLVKETDGTDEANANAIRSKGYISVSASTQYYFKLSYWYRVCWYDANKNFISGAQISTTNVVTAPANAIFMRFSTNATYGSTYNHDITISLYYSGESGYDQYYPYEVLATIDTGTESLYSAGNACDVKTPDGTITRNIGSVDLGTLIWLYDSSGAIFYALISDIKSPSAGTVIGNIVCSKYQAVARNSLLNNGEIALSTNKYINIKDSAYSDAATFKAAMSGVYLYYELAEPTTEQGTPFTESVKIDDFGSLSWSDTDIPQGNKIFYPVDYKAFVDTLVNHTEGDAGRIVLADEITDAAFNARGYYKIEDLSSGITDVAGLTYQFKKLYKSGNIVTLTIRARNETGSEVSAGSTLFTLPSGTYQTATIFHFNGALGNNSSMFNVGNNGSNMLATNSAIPNNTTISIMISYAIS